MLNHRSSKFYQSSRGRWGRGGGGVFACDSVNGQCIGYSTLYIVYSCCLLSAVMRGASVCDLIDGVSNSCGQTGTIANTKS